MYNVTEKFNEKMLSDERQLKIRAAFKYTQEDEGILLTGEDHLQEMELEEVVNSENSITMGSACSSKLTVKLIDAPAAIDYDRAVIDAEAGIILDDGSVEYVPLGTFHVKEVKNNNNYGDITITAYDSMCLTEQEYITSLMGFPVNIESVAEEIASMAGVSLRHNTEFADYKIDFIPEGVSMRQMLCYIAGVMGCFARINRNNELEFSWYRDEGICVYAKQQYLNGLEKTLDSDIAVTGIVSGSEEKSYSRGQGSAGTLISFENPYMNESIIEDIWVDKIASLGEFTTFAKYSGEPDENSMFSAIYRDTGEWDISSDADSDMKLFIGDCLMVSAEESESSLPSMVKVERIDDGNITLCTLKGEEIEEVPIGSTASFKRVIQWICEDVTELDLGEGDVLEITEAEGWDYRPERVIISGINESTGEVVLLDINGNVIEDIPKETVCTLLCRKLEFYKMKFMPCELKWRGNMAVQAGDVITAEDGEGVMHKVFVMSQTMVLDGGLEMKTVCEGDLDNDVSFSSASPTAQRINRVYSSLQETIKDVTQKLTGKAGGNISFVYNDAGVPTEMLIMDTDDINTAKKIWKWNSRGLSYRREGDNGPVEIAIAENGTILGQVIAANSIKGESLEIESVVEYINNDDKAEIQGKRVYFGKEPLNKYIEASVSSTGGSNLIYNSTGAAGPFDDWIIDNELSAVEYLHEGEFRDRLISQRAFRIGNQESGGKLTKVIPVNIGFEHTLSFKVKRGLADFKVTLADGDDRKIVYPDENIKEHKLTDQWVFVVYNFTPDTAEVQLVIEGDAGESYIGDIMLCAGLSSTWTQSSNEVFGTNVMLTKDRLTIAPEAKETEGVKTVITSTGMDIVNNRQPEDVIASYTNSGTLTKSLHSKGQLSSGKTRMVPMDDIGACMWIINE